MIVAQAFVETILDDSCGGGSERAPGIVDIDTEADEDAVRPADRTAVNVSA